MATISDVARHAGVSPATVSRVLNRPQGVTADKRDRVLAAILALDYRPNAVARSLRRGSTQTLALLVGDISQPFHGRMAKAVERAAEKYGYNVLLCDLDHSRDRLVNFLRSLPHSGVDGVIIATADNLDNAPVRQALTELLETGVPAVSTSQRIDAPPVPAVTPDYRAVARAAASHLLHQQRWPIAFVGGGPDSYLSEELRAGFESACREAGHEPVPRLMTDGNYRAETAQGAVGTLLDHLPLQGVVAISTPMALGAYAAAVHRNRRVPSDIAVVSCEDIALDGYLQPTLTGVQTDLDRYGQCAVELLMSTLTDEETPASVIMPHLLVPRESSGPPTPKSRS